MVITKGCPRCQGDLAHVDDVGDTYYSCVQCGFVKYDRQSGQKSDQQTAAPRALFEIVREHPRADDATGEERYRRRLLRRLAERQRTSVPVSESSVA